MANMEIMEQILKEVRASKLAETISEHAEIETSVVIKAAEDGGHEVSVGMKGNYSGAIYAAFVLLKEAQEDSEIEFDVLLRALEVLDKHSTRQSGKRMRKEEK